MNHLIQQSLSDNDLELLLLLADKIFGKNNHGWRIISKINSKIFYCDKCNIKYLQYCNKTLSSKINYLHFNINEIIIQIGFREFNFINSLTCEELLVKNILE